MLKLLVFSVAVAAVWGMPRAGKPSFEKFGRPNPDGRIVDGHDVDIADYPYHLGLFYESHLVCGASLIGPKFALTAASCTFRKPVEEFWVIAGSTDLDGGQTVDVAYIYEEPHFNNFYDRDYDVAVLGLAEAVTAEHAAPIALHDSGYTVQDGTDVTIGGWGELVENGPVARDLQIVATKVLNHELCYGVYGERITDRMVCTGNLTEGGHDSCNLDGGSPLVVHGKQYGIVSWEYGCAKPGSPAVNSKITEASIRQFIKRITGL